MCEVGRYARHASEAYTYVHAHKRPTPSEALDVRGFAKCSLLDCLL